MKQTLSYIGIMDKLNWFEKFTFLALLATYWTEDKLSKAWKKVRG